MNQDHDNTELRANPPPRVETAEILVEKRRGLSIIWLIPLVAAVIGLWLVYKTFSERGPLISIIFQDAVGLEAGKTKVRYKALDVGEVETIRLSDDLSRVMVQARIHKELADRLGETTQFWLVQPQIGLRGVTGLETLVSGTYIGVAFGGAKPTRQFTALTQAPLIAPDTPGRQYVLTADRLGSLGAGSPIYFRGVQVGEILGSELAPDMATIQLHSFVRAPHDDLVRRDSRFWRVSGLDVSLTSQGLDVKMQSLAALALGGVSFDTPSQSQPGVPSEEGAHFPLYDSLASVQAAGIVTRNPFLLYFNGSVRGLSAGAPVEFRGIQVGTVASVTLEFDPAGQPRIPVVIDLEPDRFLTPEEQEQYQAAAQAQTPHIPHVWMEKLVRAGLRAQLQTGSLLTGQLFVALDFHPDSPRAQLIYGGRYPEIPTVPTGLEAIETTVVAVLENLKKLPLDKIGNEAAAAMQNASRLLGDPGLKAALQSLNPALKDVQRLVLTADRELPALAASLEKTLTAARAVLQNVEPGAPMAVDLANMLEELAAGARSIRLLSDYLERHPDALLYGKGKEPGVKP